MSKAYRVIFCFDAYVRRGGAWVGWWDDGEGTESALRLHFHLRKIGRIYIKIHLYPYAPPDYLCDFH